MIENEISSSVLSVLWLYLSPAKTKFSINVFSFCFEVQCETCVQVELHVFLWTVSSVN
jgi:hypothetical protein